MACRNAGNSREADSPGFSVWRSPCQNNPGSAPATTDVIPQCSRTTDMPLSAEFPTALAVQEIPPSPVSRAAVRLLVPYAALFCGLYARGPWTGPGDEPAWGRLRRPGVPGRLGAAAPRGSAFRSAPGKSLRRFSGSPVPPGRAGHGRAVRVRPELKVALLLEFRLAASGPLRPGVARPKRSMEGRTIIERVLVVAIHRSADFSEGERVPVVRGGDGSFDRRDERPGPRAGVCRHARVVDQARGIAGTAPDSSKFRGKAGRNAPSFRPGGRNHAGAHTAEYSPGIIGGGWDWLTSWTEVL